MSDDLHYEPTMPPSPSGPGKGAAASPPKKSRSGSEKRQRAVINKFRSTAAESAEIRANAKAAGLTFGSYIRALGCDHPTTRAIRAPLPELAPFRAAYGKLAIACSNAHQLLRLANRGEYPDIEEVRETHRKLNTAADELLAVLRGYSGDYQR
jgi:hypothetical protein